MQPLLVETLEYRKKQKIELIEMTTGFIDDPAAAVLLLRVGAYKSDLIVCPPPLESQLSRDGISVMTDCEY